MRARVLRSLRALHFLVSFFVFRAGFSELVRSPIPGTRLEDHRTFVGSGVCTFSMRDLRSEQAVALFDAKPSFEIRAVNAESSFQLIL